MIYILHPTFFTLANSLNSSSGRRRLIHFKFSAEVGVFGSCLFDVFIIDEAGFLLAIACGSYKVTAPIYTNNIIDVRDIAFCRIISHRYIQEIFSMFVYKLRRAKLMIVWLKYLDIPSAKYGSFTRPLSVFTEKQFCVRE